MPIDISRLEEEMREAIRSSGQKPLIVCGAGVSIAATKGKAPSWTKLIESGVQRVRDYDKTAEAKEWANAASPILAGKDAGAWIKLADELTERLGGATHAVFADWLDEAIGKLSPDEPAIPRAIIDLDCPVATTNYDSILCKVAGIGDICWSNHAGMMRVMSGRREGILHIHGYWMNPAHVVLGQKVYDALVGNTRTQMIQQFAALGHPTIFVGCSREGLTDPDFSRLSGWLTGWKDAAQKRYWLIRDSETAKPDMDRNLFPVPFGEKHEDLLPLLQRLAPPKAPPHGIADPNMIGREDEKKALLGHIGANEFPVVIPGGPGMGKTTLALSAACDADVIRRFGRHRHFVAMDSALSADAMLGLIAQAAGAAPTGSRDQVIAGVAQASAQGERLLILDNLETPWEREPREVEAILNALAQAPGLRLVITIRGGAPRLARGRRMRDIERLPDADAKALFLRYAGEHVADDPALPGLLKALDGHALSIRLLASRHEDDGDLSLLQKLWEKEKADLLREDAGDTRLTSTRASLRLSLSSPRMSAPAKRLLSLLALLPDGLFEGDLDALLPGEGEKAALDLAALRLASRRDGRLCMLAPLRESALMEVVPDGSDFNRMFEYFGSVLRTGWLYPAVENAMQRQIAIREIANFDSLLERAIREISARNKLNELAKSLANAHRFTGLGSINSIEGLAKESELQGDSLVEADCHLSLGTIAWYRCDFDVARSKFAAAMVLYQGIGNLQGEANCIAKFGDLAFARSDHGAALSNFLKAIPFYKSIGDVLGEANCIHTLGELALERGEFAVASWHFESARLLFKQVGYVLGEANCAESLGDLALERSDFDTAWSNFETGLPLFRSIGNLVGEANCTFSLGDIALARADHRLAMSKYKLALSLYRRVGSLQGEANCIRGIGDVLKIEGQVEHARNHWQQALTLYEQIAEPFSGAETHIRLAGTEKLGAESDSHIEAARNAWVSIGRDDMIKKFITK